MRANDTQVGGGHYRVEYQHWDFAHDLDLGYFEGQITKYITRHRRKNGLQDVQKARHFTAKLLELTIGNRQPRHLYPLADQLRRYGAANGLGQREMDVIIDVTNWRWADDLRRVLTTIDLLVSEQYAQPTPQPPVVKEDWEQAKERAERTLAAALKPCRSPYCECQPGACSHPGFYDARGNDGSEPGASYVNQDR